MPVETGGDVVAGGILATLLAGLTTLIFKNRTKAGDDGVTVAKDLAEHKVDVATNRATVAHVNAVEKRVTAQVGKHIESLATTLNRMEDKLDLHIAANGGQK